MTPATRQLIVNADDLGMSPQVNEGVARAHRRGLVTSTSLMATREAWDDALHVLRALPRLAVGVHLTWVDGRPLSAASTVPSLLDGRGRFLAGWPALVRRYVAGRLALDEVEQEAQAQIERVIAAGLRPDHLDSHEHVHLLPGVFERVVRLAQRYEIPAIRVPAEPAFDGPGDWGRCVGVLRRGVLRLLSCRARRVAEAAGVWVAPRCYGIADSCRLTEARVLRLLRQLPEGISELMCHPGIGYESFGNRPRELQALTSAAVQELLAGQGIVLTTFRGCL